MRGRNADGVAAAQKRRVLLIACSMVLMLSLLSIYHGSFFRYHRLHNKNKLIREERFSNDDDAGGRRGSSSSSKALEVTAVEEEQEEEENDHPLTAKFHDNTGKFLDARVTAEEEEAAATTGNNEQTDEKYEQSDGQDDSEDKNDSNDSDENDKEIEVTRDERSSVEESESSADDSSSSDDEGTDDLPLKSIPVCDSQYTDLIPCLDRRLQTQMKIKLNTSLMEHYERHCPPPERRLNCLIPPPPNYKVPIRWPASRDEVWQANVPHTFLATEKSDQHWMVVNNQKVNFPGGGTHFPDGADKYIVHLGKMLKNKDGNLSSGGKIRTVLDVGCGVASFGAYLLDLDILAMSLAPNDVHQNQIQFALERGIPATLGVFGTMRLPYPSKSFDLAHCSRCRIDWAQRGGILLLEVDRLLRPGGYFAWSSPPVYRDDPEDANTWKEMVDLVGRMCWTIAAKDGQTVIWAKPLTNECYEKREVGTEPLLCSDSIDIDAAWQEPMKTCITPLIGFGRGLEPWPKRMSTPPPRLKDLGLKEKDFADNSNAWKRRVEFYWKQLKTAKQVEQNSIRNIMDMNANLGGFAAALRTMNMPVWVMNVVPNSSPNSLKVVYDRGFIGSFHNWCEAYSTYPRTYDLLHAWGVLSDIYDHDCSVEDLLLEMDRLLRPYGLVIMRDRGYLIDRVSKQLDALHWNAWSTVLDAEKDEISDADEKILLARKQLWQPEDIL